MTMNQKFEDMCARGEVFGSIPEDVIIAAETELKVSFPQQYRDFLRRFGSGLIGGLEIYGLPDPKKNNPPLWQDVVKVTKQLREWAQSGSENPAYVPITEDGTGVFFFLDTRCHPTLKS